MARNEEKAQSMLYRFREAMAVEAGLIRPKNEMKPRHISQVTTLKDAEFWRQQTFKDISMKVSRIQNPGLSDYEVRELNDEINSLLREKGRWEFRIKELGGKNYMKSSRILDNEGRDIAGTRGYKYFGRARNLPGVKEYLESKDTLSHQKSSSKNEIRSKKAELLKNAPRFYYGDEDDLDGNLEPIEREEEESLWNASMNEWKRVVQTRLLEGNSASNQTSLEEEIKVAQLSLSSYIPSQEEVAKYILERNSLHSQKSN